MHATILIPVVLTSAFLTGIADACSVTLFSTIIQMTDNKIRGRIAGISTLINKLGFGIGFITVPILLKNMPLSFMVASLHGLIICTCLISCIIYFRSKMQREIQIDH